MVNKRSSQGTPTINQVYLPKKKKEYGRFVRTPFHTPCAARSVLHLIGILSEGKDFSDMPRTAWRDVFALQKLSQALKRAAFIF